MDKELRFIGTLDTSQLDQQFASITQKMKAMQQFSASAGVVNKMAGQGGAPAGVPNLTQYQEQKFKTYLQDMNKSYADTQKALKAELEEHTRIKAAIESQKKETGDYNEELQETLRLKKELAKSEENIDSLQRNQAQNLKAQQVGRGGAPGGGGAGAAGNILGGILSGNIGSVIGATAIVAAISTAMNKMGEIYRENQSLPLRTASAVGSAVQGVSGNELQGIASGSVVEPLAFMSERRRAMEMASKSQEASRATDAARARSLITALPALLLDEKFRAGYAGAILPGQMGKEYSAKYEAMNEQERVQKYQEGLQAQKQTNPLKVLATQSLQQNYGQWLQTQRMLGLNDQGFLGKGGFQEQANMGGFTGDMASQMAQQIEAAGGSTRGARGSLLGLQAQRGFNLTNAGSLLGKISGGAGGEEATNQVFKKLMEESVKAGLDKSELVAENRKFTDITAEILSRSGVKSSEDAQRVIGDFSKLLSGDPTMRGIEGAKSAYEERQAFSAETSGRGGALQFAAMNQKGLGGVGFKGMAGLMEMPEQDLTTTNQYVVAEAFKAKMTPQELVRRTLAAKRSKELTEVGLNSGQMDTLSSYMNRSGLNKKSAIGTEDLEGMPEEMRGLYMKAQEAATIKSGYTSAQKREGVVRGLIYGAGQEEIAPPPGTAAARGYISPSQKVDAVMAAKETGKAADDVVAATGVAAQAMLENFRDFKKEVTPASDALDNFTKKIVQLNAALNLVPDVDKASATIKMNSSLFQNQPQGGKPAPGQTK